MIWIPVLFVGIVLAVHAFVLKPKELCKESFELPVKNIERTITIVALSDIHLGFGMNERRLAGIFNSIEGYAPDILMILGDFFDDLSRFRGDPDKVSQAINPPGLRNTLKLCVPGNHDVFSGEEGMFKSVLENGGFRLLVNESVQFEGLNIIGADDALLGNPVVEPRSGYVNVLMIHEPDYAAETFTGIDLQLSGHTHGGQVRLFGKSPILPKGGKKFKEGFYVRPAGGVLYVTRGVGVSNIHIRFGTKPEITLITLTPDKRE